MKNNMSRNTFILLASVAIFAFPVIVSATPATGDSTSTATPATGDSSSTAAPSTGDSSSTAGPAPVAAPAAPSVSSGGGSTSSSGSYVGGGSFMGTRVPIVNASCPLLTAYLKSGADNDPAQVTKLQTFLKNVEKLDLEVNGVFDAKTETAVRAFQAKYLSEVMGPWGASQSSGLVYITTLKKINQLACNQPLTLNPSDLTIINSYKANQANPANPTNNSAPTNQNNIGIGEIGLNETAGASTTNLGDNENESPNVAAAAAPSVFTRLWNFVKGLF